MNHIISYQNRIQTFVTSTHLYHNKIGCLLRKHTSTISNEEREREILPQSSKRNDMDAKTDVSFIEELND